MRPCFSRRARLAPRRMHGILVCACLPVAAQGPSRDLADLTWMELLELVPARNGSRREADRMQRSQTPGNRWFNRLVIGDFAVVCDLEMSLFRLFSG